MESVPVAIRLLLGGSLGFLGIPWGPLGSLPRAGPASMVPPLMESRSQVPSKRVPARPDGAKPDSSNIEILVNISFQSVLETLCSESKRSAEQQFFHRKITKSAFRDACWGPLGAFSEPFLGLLGPSWGLLGISWSLLGPLYRHCLGAFSLLLLGGKV